MKTNKVKTYDDISNELKKRLNNTDIRLNNLMNVLKAVMEVVELTKVDGTNKKKFALSLLEQIIDEANIDKEEENECKKMINNGTISNTIDLVILASKNKVKINKRKGVIKRISRTVSSKARVLQKRQRRSHRNSF